VATPLGSLAISLKQHLRGQASIFLVSTQYPWGVLGPTSAGHFPSVALNSTSPDGCWPLNLSLSIAAPSEQVAEEAKCDVSTRSGNHSNKYLKCCILSIYLHKGVHWMANKCKKHSICIYWKVFWLVSTWVMWHDVCKLFTIASLLTLPVAAIVNATKQDLLHHRLHASPERIPAMTWQCTDHRIRTALIRVLSYGLQICSHNSTPSIPR
jgi:hypothetical protein